jgi:hypothetical protein
MIRLVAASFVFLSAVPAFAQDEHIGFRVREWFTRTSGTIASEEGGLASTPLDLSDDLGLGNQVLTHELQIYGRIPFVGRLYLGWWHNHDSGNSTLEQTVTFAGQTFNQSTPISTEYTLDVAYLTYEVALPSIPLDRLINLEVSPNLSLRGIKAKGSIEGAGLSGSDSGTVGLPTLGVHVTLKLFDLIRTEAEVSGLQFRYGDKEAHYLEVYAEAVVEPLPFVFAGFGYKLASINATNGGSDPSHVDVNIAGFYITFGARF